MSSQLLQFISVDCLFSKLFYEIYIKFQQFDVYGATWALYGVYITIACRADELRSNSAVAKRQTTQLINRALTTCS